MVATKRKPMGVNASVCGSTTSSIEFLLSQTRGHPLSEPTASRALIKAEYFILRRLRRGFRIRLGNGHDFHICYLSVEIL
jgi:hypothetical protein